MYIPKSQPRIVFPLNIKNVVILNTEQTEDGDFIITVKSTEEGTCCRVCGRRITKFHGHDEWICLRHLSILGHRVYIRLRPKRYKCNCSHKPTTTQQLEWYEARSPHTKEYDEHIMLQLVNSTIEDVSQKEQVGYDAVVGALSRRIRTSVDWTQYDELKVMGIDEVALKKGHKNYAAVISTQQADGQVSVLTVLPGRKKKMVRDFLDTIPKRLRPTMETVCTDMWDGYVNAAEEFAAAHEDVSIAVVIDRFHVAKNYRDCVDKLRKSECRRLKQELSEEEYEEIKGVMWATRKNNRNLTTKERQKLRRLFIHSPDLKLAYTYREELTAIFEMELSREEAVERLTAWKAKVERSSLKCFNPFLKTLINWLEKIANYFMARLSSGFVEGLNTKIKTLMRRCYGIRRVGHIFQRLYLDIQGYRRFA